MCKFVFFSSEFFLSHINKHTLRFAYFSYRFSDCPFHPSYISKLYSSLGFRTLIQYNSPVWEDGTNRTAQLSAFPSVFPITALLSSSALSFRNLLESHRIGFPSLAPSNMNTDFQIYSNIWLAVQSRLLIIGGVTSASTLARKLPCSFALFLEFLLIQFLAAWSWWGSKNIWIRLTLDHLNWYKAFGLSSTGKIRGIKCENKRLRTQNQVKNIIEGFFYHPRRSAVRKGIEVRPWIQQSPTKWRIRRERGGSRC